MRELEFLPDWYPRVRRRRKRLARQAWCASIFVVALAVWQIVANRATRHNEQILVDLRGRLDGAAVELQKETQLEVLKAEINRKLAINAKVGTPVETTRLLRATERCMPESMTLTSFSAELEERRGAGTGKLAAARAAQKDEVVERRLRVTVVGVAPTDAELAEFLRKLSDVPVFEQVTMTYARPREDDKYVMRESEVTFSVDLTGPGVPAIAPAAATATASGN